MFLVGLYSAHGNAIYLEEGVAAPCESTKYLFPTREEAEDFADIMRNSIGYEWDGFRYVDADVAGVLIFSSPEGDSEERVYFDDDLELFEA